MTPAGPARVLITGACRGIGRACAEQFAAKGAVLILADNDTSFLSELSQQLDATGRYCDVASEASVTIFAAEIMNSFPEIDIVINAAGGGYERTLGMYRVSRALMPALRSGQHCNVLLNIPPAVEHAAEAIFPYASSQQAFQRLSAALAAETRGSSIKVLIGCPQARDIFQVLPDTNARGWHDVRPSAGSAEEDERKLAQEIATLIEPDLSRILPVRRAG
jgi:hypothetical protein